MDVLPVQETSGKPWASKVFGKMHACGHDGHTAMLLSVARHLAATRCFDGTVHVVFQPACGCGWPRLRCRQPRSCADAQDACRSAAVTPLPRHPDNPVSRHHDHLHRL